MRKCTSLPRQSAQTFRIILQWATCLGILGAGLLAQNQPTPLSAANPKPTLGGQVSLSTPSATLHATASPTRIADLQKIGTPTPGTNPQANTSQSPVVIGRAPRALPRDGNTLALFHFDRRVGNETPDETGKFTGTLVNNVSLVSGLFGNALKGDGRYGPGSYVRAGSIGALSQGTIEAYVDFSSACQGQYSFTMISVGGDFGSGVEGARLIDDGDLLNFEILAADGWHVASSSINACRYLAGGNTAPYFYPSPVQWPYDTWRFHHVAGTWGPRGMEIWVDGVLHGITYPDYFTAGFYPNNGLSCNPQLQLGMVPPWIPNPDYPYCPHTSPQMGRIDYRGVYTGGIPANTNIIIGCDPNGITDYCFGGRLDDVRISNIQRIFTVEVDPPSSPTPTSTPDKISREYAVDGYTTALYHMNSLTTLGYVPDATGQYDAALKGGAGLVPDGRYNGALFVYGNNAYALARTGDTRYGTVEAWVKIYDPILPLSILSIGTEPGGYYEYLSLGTSHNGTLQFGVFDNTTMRWANSGVAATSLAGCWHHVAGTWGSRGVEIWVDGVNRGSNSYAGQLYATGGFVMGCDGHSECMTGYIDEVRLSNIQRYFTTPDVLAPARARAPAAPSNGGFSLFLPFVKTIYVATPPVCPWG